jgi:WD40 repeat protein
LALSRHKSHVACAGFSDDGSRVVTGGHDKVVKVWDAENGALLWSRYLPGGWIRHARFFDGDRRILAASPSRAL